MTKYILNWLKKRAGIYVYRNDSKNKYCIVYRWNKTQANPANRITIEIALLLGLFPSVKTYGKHFWGLCQKCGYRPINGFAGLWCDICEDLIAGHWDAFKVREWRELK